LIDDNFLATERDRLRMLEGVKLSRRLARGSVFGRFQAGELIPGDAVADDALLEVVAANLATYGHPTSTVPMGGANDPRAVVDSRGAVRGLSNIRVVDASIIPEIPSTVRISPRSWSLNGSSASCTGSDRGFSLPPCTHSQRTAAIGVNADLPVGAVAQH
jgi:GMC oxidoreductase